MAITLNRNEAINKVLDLLRKHLGTREVPPGSNHNFITEWYNANVAKIGDGPWCQMTDTWSVWSVGFKSLMPGSAYTVTAAQNAQKGMDGSSWHYGVNGMHAGDQVYYDWGGDKGSDAVIQIDHTGTIEHVNGDGTFYVLEGNASDKLMRVKRDKTYVVGYVRHDWNKVSILHAHAKPKKTPAAPVVVKPTPVYVDEVTKHPHISQIQHAVGVPVTGIWDEVTDTAVLKFREKHRQKK